MSLAELIEEAPAARFRRTACGSLWMGLGRGEVSMRRSGALWLAASATLIVSDLHLEKGSAYASKGQLLPPYDTKDALDRLDRELMALNPRLLVLLGDSFHDVRSVSRLAQEDAHRIAGLASGRTLLWIVGNHDAEGPGGLPGEIADEIEIDGLVLRHEPLLGPRPGEVSGHLHPCAKLIHARRSVRRRAFATDGERLIVPAFGSYAGGLNICDPAYLGLFTAPPTACVLGPSQVHPIPFAALCGD